MKHAHALWRCAWMALLAGVLSAFSVAQAKQQDALFEKHEVYYRIQADASYTTRYLSQTRVLTERVLEAMKSRSISHSASVEQSRILQAYTLKADGRKIAVPGGNYQRQVNTGVSGKPAFSDYVRTTVLFPELKVGDAVVLEYEVQTREPIFPGHFSLWRNFSRDTPYLVAKVTIDAPKSLAAEFGSKDMAQTVTEKGERRIVSWTFENPQPQDSQRENFSVYDPEADPYLAFTTFKNYGQIAQAYGVRALPKAHPTERVRKLSDELAANQPDARSKTRAIYDWVAQHIEYAGNCIGVGAVVPRDLDFVLDNKMGDCKDHATLLQAMLAAQGIESHQMLVNASAVYTLPRYPVASMVNHVFTYVPALELYLDSTSSNTPFGLLPQAVQAKPVLWVTAGGSDLAPAPKVMAVDGPQVNRTQFDSTLIFDEKGNASGTVTIKLQGHLAAAQRARYRHWAPEERQKFVQNHLQRMTLKGSGDIDYDDPEPMTDHFTIRIRYQAESVIDEEGGLLPLTLIGSPRGVESFVASAIENNPTDDAYPSACANGQAEERYTVTLPSNLQLGLVPRNFEHRSADLDFDATYRRDSQTLHVQRKLLDKSPGGVCSPQQLQAYRTAAQAVWKHLRRQIIYQPVLP